MAFDKPVNGMETADAPTALAAAVTPFRIPWLAVLSVLTVAVLSACSGGPVATPTPTVTPVPTGMPTATPAPTPTPAPTGTPVPTVTPVPTGTLVPTATPVPTSTPVPTATPVPTLQPSEAIAALEWVSDGLAPSETPSVEQLELASATSQRYFRALMDAPWVRKKQKFAIWEEVVSELTQLAALDEDAALRALELELAETIEYADVVTIGFLRSLVSSDPEGLRRLLSHPSLDESAADGEDRFLPLLYLEMHDPNAATLVEALPWVQDGLRYLDFSYVVDLVRLAGISPRALQATLREERDWLPPGPGALEYPEALRHINSVAAVDEEAALSIIDMPFLETVEEPYFDALERLAALAASHPQDLPEVVAHPAVTNGDEALVGAIIRLLALRLRDPEVSAALEGLPWVKEGILEYMEDTASADPDPLRQDFADVFDLLLLLERGPSGRELFLSVAANAWMQNGMTDYEREVVSALVSESNREPESALRLASRQSLDAIAALPWLQSGEEPYELSHIQTLVQLGGLEDDRVFWAVLDRPWAQDGITSDEADLIGSLLRAFGETGGRLWEALRDIEGYGDYELSISVISLHLGQRDPEAAAALAALPWVQDAIGMTHEYSGETILENLVFVWESWSEQPSLFLDLLSKPWVRDRVDRHEQDMLKGLGYMSTAWAGRLLPMPFLDTVEPTEVGMMTILSEMATHHRAELEGLLERPDIAEGLTDDNLGAVALYRLRTRHPRAAAAIESLPWYRLGMGASAWDRTLELIYLVDYYDDRVFWAVLDRSWAQDGITSNEADLILSLQGRPAEDALRFLEMPFLESLEGWEADAIGDLRFEDGSYRLYPDVSPTLSDGITDDEAIRLAALSIVNHERLESLAPAILDPERASLAQRSVSLPLSGDITLAVIEVGSGASVLLDALERIVRVQEEFMGVPLPTSYVVLLIADANDKKGSARSSGVITADPYLTIPLNTIAHEAGHIYWSGGGGWIREGGAMLMETITMNAIFSPYGPRTITGCALATNIGEFEQVVDDLYASEPMSALDTIHRSGCSYSLGQGLFLDLYRELGRDTFRQGFARLHTHFSPGLKYGESSIIYVRVAFVDDAAPEAAAIAERVIDKWYNGDPFP